MDFSDSDCPGLGLERLEAFGDRREIVPEFLHRLVPVDGFLDSAWPTI